GARLALAGSRLGCSCAGRGRAPAALDAGGAGVCGLGPDRFLGLPSADGVLAPSRLRQRSLDADKFSAGAYHPRAILGTDLSPGAPSLSGRPQPSLTETGPAT